MTKTLPSCSHFYFLYFMMLAISGSSGLEQTLPLQHQLIPGQQANIPQSAPLSASTISSCSLKLFLKGGVTSVDSYHRNCSSVWFKTFPTCSEIFQQGR